MQAQIIKQNAKKFKTHSWSTNFSAILKITAILKTFGKNFAIFKFLNSHMAKK
jgi:hypothetical protein